MNALKNLFYAGLAVAIATCIIVLVLRIAFIVAFGISILLLAVVIFVIFKILQVFNIDSWKPPRDRW